MPDVPAGAADVARRYLRAERFVTTTVALTLALLGGLAVVFLPLLWGLAAALGILVVARVPAFGTEAHTRLRTDADPEAVREAFTGPTPPPLALQWGIADAVGMDGAVAVYEISYFLGLRSADLRVESELTETEEGSRIVLTVTVNGEPWGTYTATTVEGDDTTEVVIDLQSDRRFGLRRLPQQLVARRYRDATLTAQGYEVLERDGSLGL